MTNNSKISPWILATLLLALVLGGSVVGYMAYAWRTATTTDDVRNLISKNLPVGSSADEIITFLDDQGIDHGPIDKFGNYSYGQDFDYPADTPVIDSLWRHAADYIVTKTDIVVLFILDSEHRLSTYEIFEVHSSI